MRSTLVVSASYEPIRVVSWERAVRLWFGEKADIIESYDETLHSPSREIKCPAVVRLTRYVRQPGKERRRVKFSRSNLYQRDRFTCQYCGEKFTPKELTFDHVLPKSKGGHTTWRNVVASCIGCNRKKGNRPLEQTGLKLIKEPKEPHWAPGLVFGFATVPPLWEPYLQFH